MSDPISLMRDTAVALALVCAFASPAQGAETDALDDFSLSPAETGETVVVTDAPPSPAPIVAPLPVAAKEGRYSVPTFRRHAGTVQWELLAVTAAISATRVTTFVKHPARFRFENEGWFGKKTESLGMDKMHHAYKTYVLTDVLQNMISKRTGDKKGAAYSGAIMGLGLMTYGELFDGFSKGHGWSNQDMTVHLAGAGISLLRNAVPGLRDKLDFRMEMKPSFKGEAFELVNQLDDRKYLFAGQLAGFKRFEKSPLRYVELHLGYYARGFTEAERLRGDPLRRKIYVGIGLNVQELLFPKPKSGLERKLRGALDYLQLPYTGVELN